MYSLEIPYKTHSLNYRFTSQPGVRIVSLRSNPCYLGTGISEGKRNTMQNAKGYWGDANKHPKRDTVERNEKISYRKQSRTTRQNSQTSEVHHHTPHFFPTWISCTYIVLLLLIYHSYRNLQRFHLSFDRRPAAQYFSKWATAVTTSTKPPSHRSTLWTFPQNGRSLLPLWRRMGKRLALDRVIQIWEIADKNPSVETQISGLRITPMRAMDT